MSEMDALDHAIGQYVQRGWDVHQATLTGVQLKHPSGRSVYLTAEMAKRGDLPQIAQTPWMYEVSGVKGAGVGEPSFVREAVTGFAEGFFGGPGAWKGPVLFGVGLVGVFLLWVASVVF